ncbi:MAG: tRNA1(Val) (adenine(37)-N6)-methyltransferase [Alistipes sp.]
MANDYFAFKRFTVRQPRSAMRVGTDGVLLGAWCDPAPADGRMLDVGTGTGVIALILAQRNPSARIDAVEIDEGGCLDAEGNFAASPWAGRLTLYRRPFADFAAGCPVRYDRIVSNPPYFVASLQSPDPARTAARHAESLSYADLAAGAARLLVPSGRLSVILPVETACDFAALALSEGLYRVRTLAVRGSGRSRQAAVRGVFPEAAGFAGGGARDRGRRPPRIQRPLQGADGRFLPENVSLFLEK